jgi:hypothetical protein
VVEVDDHALRVAERPPDGLEALDGERGGVVVAHDRVELGHHDLAGPHLAAEAEREDLFDQRSHG